MDRAHVDQGARLLGVHMAHAGLGGEECAVEVDGQQSFPFGIGEILDSMHDLHPGVRHQRIDPSPLPGHGINTVIDRGFLSDVHGHG